MLVPFNVPGGIAMFRKLFVPVLAAAALAGCVTTPGYYSGGNGGYYSAQPSVRYYGGANYGYGDYGYGGYGSPYSYYGGYSQYPYYYRRPIVIRPPHGHRPGDGHNHGGGHGNGHGNGNGHGGPDRPRPPWRDWNGRGGRDDDDRRHVERPRPVVPSAQPRQIVERPQSQPRYERPAIRERSEGRRPQTSGRDRRHEP